MDKGILEMIPTWKRTCNVDLSNLCTLECPQCLRQTYINNGEKPPGQILTLEQFDKLSDYFRGFSFCGQISDPIFNPHLKEFLKMCYDKKKWVSVHTAASHRPKKWWNDAFDANTNAIWLFGIDGLPYESFLHRINQDGEHLFEMMCLAKSKGINCVWQYIVFSYNENHLEEALELAKKYDITINFVKSSRWENKKNRWLKPKNPKWWIVRPWEYRDD